MERRSQRLPGIKSIVPVNLLCNKPNRLQLVTTQTTHTTPPPPSLSSLLLPHFLCVTKQRVKHTFVRWHVWAHRCAWVTVDRESSQRHWWWLHTHSDTHHVIMLNGEKCSLTGHGKLWVTWLNSLSLCPPITICISISYMRWEAGRSQKLWRGLSR